MELHREARYQSGVDQTSEAEKTYQAAKYAEIIEILLSAGYFRARITGLSEFDKVVGGLCWCITSSGADIDVDILFQENSTIGQRIKLSETIVMVLRKMRCPHPLQAHQIQGSDFPALHPVIVWLVKKFFENREATAARLRKYAQLCFSKDYELPGEGLEQQQQEEEQQGGVAAVTSRFRPERKYHRKLQAGALSTEDARVHSCLLEFGERHSALVMTEEGEELEDGAKPPSDAELSAFEKKLRQAQREAEREEEEIRRRQEEQRQELMRHLAAEGGKGVVSGSEVGRIVGLMASQISQAAAGYDEMLEEARRRLEEGGGGAYAQIASYKRQQEALEKQIRSQEAELEQQRQALQETRDVVAQLEQGLTKSRAYNARIVAETAKLTELEEKSDKKAELARLKQLVALNEALKAQETQFKAGCKRQLAALEEELRRAKGEAGPEDEEEQARLAQIEALHAKTMAKHSKLRQLLAEQNLSIASTSRRIDDVPARAELLQYERRFAELYDQVALKLEETRKYYDMYNTLDSTRDILRRQVKLLNSISESFETAVRSKAAREDFLRQFENINKGVEDLYVSKRRSLEQKAAKLEQAKAHHQSLLEEQRRYFKAVKDFQEECNRNDALAARLAELEGGAPVQQQQQNGVHATEGRGA